MVSVFSLWVFKLKSLWWFPDANFQFRHLLVSANFRLLSLNSSHYWLGTKNQILSQQPSLWTKEVQMGHTVDSSNGIPKVWFIYFYMFISWRIPWNFVLHISIVLKSKDPMIIGSLGATNNYYQIKLWEEKTKFHTQPPKNTPEQNKQQ